MPRYSLSHLSDSTLLRDLATLVARDRATTAQLLAHLAEIDARKLYLPAAYPSMYAYCVGELRMSEDAAYKRIQAARAARRFPAILDLVADGRLHLGAVCLLAPYLFEDTAQELLASATHKTKGAIEQLIAERFPRPDLPTLVEARPGPLRPIHSVGQLAPGQVGTITVPAFPQLSPGIVGTGTAGSVNGGSWGSFERSAPERTGSSAPGRMAASGPGPRLTPLAPERYALRVTIGQSTHDKLRYARPCSATSFPRAISPPSSSVPWTP